MKDVAATAVDVATINRDNLVMLMSKRYINDDGTDVTPAFRAAMRKSWGGKAAGVRDEKTGEWGKIDFSKADTFNTASSLPAINLVPGAEVMVPKITPLRNKFPRTKGSGIGAQWRQVTALGLAGAPFNPFIAEKTRAQRVTATTKALAANYRTAGLESDVTFEAQHQAVGFDDLLELGNEITLLQAMMMEEAMLMCANGGGANNTTGIGTTPTPVAAAFAGTGPTAGTYSVICIAGSYESYINCSVATGTPLGAATVTAADGKTYTVNGGIGGKSAAAAVTTSGGNLSIKATVGTVTTDGSLNDGVSAAGVYYWFLGAAGAEKLEAVTTINSLLFTATAFVGTGVAASTFSTTDYSYNATAYDGLLYLAINDTTGPSNTRLAYYAALPTGTAGTGTVLTVSPRGTITQIDTMLQAYWANYRISPAEIWVNAQELGNIYNKVLANGNQALVRFVQPLDPNDPKVTIGQTVAFYVNPYQLGGVTLIPIKLHPFLPPGTIVALCDDTGPWYPYASLGGPFEVQCIADYYAIPWPYVDRSTQVGVYWESVLICKWRALIGVIKNIGNG